MGDGTAETGLGQPSLQVSLPAFAGPLDLLLYLIKKNRLNIYDIPIARITEEYLRSLEQMRSLNLETAGHFL
ncbi:MAG TPA: segregation/condensation protein A, partial [Syntrophobacteraceae bacterium]|nr:segregation/condensation protein A [Syntrophobacteraceae bacterium]